MVNNTQILTPLAPLNAIDLLLESGLIKDAYDHLRGFFVYVARVRMERDKVLPSANLDPNGEIMDLPAFNSEDRKKYCEVLDRSTGQTSSVFSLWAIRFTVPMAPLTKEALELAYDAYVLHNRVREANKPKSQRRTLPDVFSYPPEAIQFADGMVTVELPVHVDLG